MDASKMTDATTISAAERLKAPVVRTVGEIRAAVRDWRREGLTVGLVPTMGGLHDGHLSLIRLAQSRVDRVVASIFVNPTQFDDAHDFEVYPRTEEADLALLAQEGCDLAFCPTVKEMYPRANSTEVRVEAISGVLCGAARPGHFEGVALVVSKLLNQVQPDLAVFGEKDFQQLQVIRTFVADLDMPVEILGAPTVRDANGLALSSRNARLTPAERERAALLSRVLVAAAERIAAGETPQKACADAACDLFAHGFERIDYLEARTEERLQLLRQGAPAEPARVFAAVRLAGVRLIDNVEIPRKGRE